MHAMEIQALSWGRLASNEPKGAPESGATA